MNKLDELRQKHKEMGEAIKRLEENGGQWVPERGGEYWAVMHSRVTKTPIGVCGIGFSNDYTDKLLMRQGNMYRTEEEAERALEMEKYEFERSLHIADVNRLIDEKNLETGWVADWDDMHQHKVRLAYDYDDNLVSRCSWSFMEVPSELKPFNPIAFDQIKSQLTQEQIDYIWRLNKPEGVK